MTDRRDASPSAAAPAAPQQWQLPWSSSSPPSPIELWHVAREAAAARTALEEEEQEEENEEEERRAEEEEDEGARQAETFDPASTLSHSDHDNDDDEEEEEEEEGSRWAIDELLSVQQRRSVEEPGEGEEGGGGEGDEGRGRSSPSGFASRPPRNRRRSLSRRSRSPSLGEEPSTDERLDDLIDSMLAMTAVGQHEASDDDGDDDAENVPLQRKEKRKQKEGEQQKEQQQRLCACCGKPRRPRRKEASKSPSSTAVPAVSASDNNRSTAVLCELQQQQQHDNAPGWNYRVEASADEAEGDGEKGGDVRRARQASRLLPPLRRRRRAAFSSSSSSSCTFDRDSTSPQLIVDRVARFEQLSAIWARDPFLAAGGDQRAPRRAGRGARGLLAAAFAAEHALLGGGGGARRR